MKDDTAAYGGVDWASESHAVCVVDGAGEIVSEYDIPDSAAGLDRLCRRLQADGVCRVAIERPDGPVVEALMAGGFGVVIVPSRAVKGLRTRYGQAGNRTDASDAYVLADCLRTDGHRLRSLERDAPETVTLRAHVRARKDLIRTRVAVANQLRAHLALVFLGAVGLFHDIDSPISLRFLRRFPSATKATWLSEKRLSAWLRANGYCGGKSPRELWARGEAARHGAMAQDGDARSSVTLA